jgi:hypothetical protein
MANDCEEEELAAAALRAALVGRTALCVLCVHTLLAFDPV